MIRSPLVFVAAMLLCAVEVRCEEVTAAKVCAVQGSIRWRAPAFTPATCERVAKALNATPSPLLTMAILVNESDMRFHVATQAKPGTWDAGGMGIRCVLRSGRCTNGLAKGYTLAQIMDPATNIEVGARILAASGSLRAYNGQSEQGEKDARKAKRMTYAEKIGALEAALRGEQVAVKGKRMRELVRKIVEAVKGEART